MTATATPPAPSRAAEPERVTQFLNHYLGFIFSVLRLGEVGAGPYPLKLPNGGPAREPDLYLISVVNVPRMTRRYFDGPPDLVIEVVSDDSPRRDNVVKYEEYEGAGVREYWIIDPRPESEGARFFVLEDGAYVERTPGPDGVYSSLAFPDVKLRVSWLFETPPPALPDALALALGPDLGMSRRA
jgi:Uma2 family endonuclease